MSYSSTLSRIWRGLTTVSFSLPVRRLNAQCTNDISKAIDKTLILQLVGNCLETAPWVSFLCLPHIPHSSLKGDLMSNTALQNPAIKHSMLTLTIDAWLDLEDPGKGSEVQRMNELLQGRGHGPQPCSMCVWHVKTREKISRQQHSQSGACFARELRSSGEEWHGEVLLLPSLCGYFLPWVQLEWGEAADGLSADSGTHTCQGSVPGWEMWELLGVLVSKGERGICCKTPFHQW